jgi:hypothetical protein
MATGVPSTNTIYGPMNRESLQGKTKLGLPIEVPGLYYNQYTPTGATVTSGTVTNSGQSLIGALQLGGLTTTVLPWGGDAVATFTSNAGLLVTTATSNCMPTTLNYDQFPVTFTTNAAGVLPSGIVAGQVYYWQWVSATTGRIAATPNGTVLPFVNAGTATIYVNAATQYWGSPWIPAGALVVADTLGQSTPNNIVSPGCSIHYEILGHKIGTGTNNYAVTPGFVTPANTFTTLTAAGSNLAAVNAGPFPFSIVGDIIIQQYGTTAAVAPYNAIAMVKCWQQMSVFSTSSTHTEAVNIWAKTVTLDLTQSYAVDVRYLAATPAIGEYMEPLVVRMWMYN